MLAAAPLNADARGSSGLPGFQPPEGETLIHAVLYFRYMDSGFLGQEQRTLRVPRTQGDAAAIVRALLDGPSAQSPLLGKLFPPGTQLHSVLEDGSRLFVTFNERLSSAMPGESGTTAARDSEGRTRRRLAMASLVNALTESGRYASVQVLVLGQPGTTNSLRLSARYYLEDSDIIPDPLTRQEDLVITPGAATAIVMEHWKQMSWQKMETLVARESPAAGITEGTFDLREFPRLLSYETSRGHPAPDGSYAVVSLSAQTMDSSGQERSLTGLPLRLLRREGVWKVSDVSLALLSEALKR